MGAQDVLIGAERRLGALQRIEMLKGEHGVHRLDALDALGMARRIDVLFEGGVAEKKRRHVVASRGSGGGGWSGTKKSWARSREGSTRYCAKS